MSEKLKAVQAAEYEILKEFDRICKKHNLEYFLDSGTALGAVRHQGFIPWDDDIDVGMARSAYERFLQVAPQELHSDYFLQTPKSDPQAPYYFTKLRTHNTEFVEWNKRHLQMHHGIYIDIFPYDNLPEKKPQAFDRKCRRLYAFWCLRTIPDRVARPKQNLPWLMKAFIRRVLHILTLPVPRQWILAHMDRVFQTYNQTDTEWVTCYQFPETFAIKRSDLLPTSQGVFCGQSFPLPHHPTDYLTALFGNYMQLPPESERINHFANIVRFNIQQQASNPVDPLKE